MNLKEAFNYRNFLNQKIHMISTACSVPEAFCVIVEKHMKSKVNPEAEDEILNSKDGTLQTNSYYDIPNGWGGIDPRVILAAYMSMTEDLKALDGAIAEAKNRAEENIDVLVSQNKTTRNELTFLLNVLSLKSKENTGTGSDYKFNNEGAQLAYIYPTKKITTIDFDRNVVKKMCDKVSDEADKRSYRIEELMLTTNVDFTPIFRTTDDIQDIFDYYSEKLV